jgi:hypothetical protein
MSNTGGVMTPYFKLHYRAIVTKPAWYWCQNGHKTNGTDDPEMKPHNYSHLIFAKEPKT